MKPHELKVKRGKNRQRVGRGIGSGRGKTAGRGTKGQRSRSGGALRPGFEGGQNPLIQRLPKLRGSGMNARFNRPKAKLIYTDQLNRFSDQRAAVDIKVLAASGLISPKDKRVKLLKRGELKESITLQVHAASQSAKKAVETAGGKIVLVNSQEPANKRKPKARK